MSKNTKSSPGPQVVTPSTMPDHFSTRSVVLVPTIKERAEKANRLVTLALGGFALDYLMRGEGAASDIDENIRTAT